MIDQLPTLEFAVHLDGTMTGESVVAPDAVAALNAARVLHPTTGRVGVFPVGGPRPDGIGCIPDDRIEAYLTVAFQPADASSLRSRLVARRASIAGVVAIVCGGTATIAALVGGLTTGAW